MVRVIAKSGRKSKELQVGLQGGNGGIERLAQGHVEELPPDRANEALHEAVGLRGADGRPAILYDLACILNLFPGSPKQPIDVRLRR